MASRSRSRKERSHCHSLFQEPDSTSMQQDEPEEEEASKSKSTPFSISTILSEEIGKKRPHVSSPPLRSEREERRSWTESIGGSPPAPSAISLMQAASIVMSPVGNPMYGSPMMSYQGSLPQPVLSYHVTPTHLTPGTIAQPSFNSSLCVSPFNSSLLSMLRNQASPPQEDAFSDSLCMLSTVALYHGELSGLNSSSSLGGSPPVQDRLAAMRLASASESSLGSLGSQEGQIERETAKSAEAAASRQSTTPCILKRDRKRRRRTSSGGGSRSGGRHSSGGPSGVLNTGFLSPLASEKAPSALSTFSPSIFLRRPERSEWSCEAASSSALAPLGSPVSEPEYSRPLSDGGSESFATSTPIKGDKENVQSMSLSPGIHVEHRGGRRLFMKDSNEVSSSGSDLDTPPKRPRLAPKKSRARTKLSPLLENACSPIAKTDPLQPSPLAAARLAPQGVLSRPPQPVAATTNSLRNMQISQGLPYPYFPPPHEAGPYTYFPPRDDGRFQFVPPPHYYAGLPQKWGAYSSGSPEASQWSGSTGQLQSVPPWFIFANNRLEGKRSRLSEAINRSLSETPAQKPKLPPEWTMYACGQTNDQKVLTEKARVFLQCRPRQLTFDDDENADDDLS